MNHLKWLLDNLEDHARLCENLARECHGAYKTEPMKSSCVLLAAAHDAAADGYWRQRQVVLKMWEAAKPVDASLEGCVAMTEGIKWRRLSSGELRVHVAVCGCGKVHNCPSGTVLFRCQTCRDRGVKAGADAGYFPVVEMYVEEWDGVAW